VTSEKFHTEDPPYQI